MNLVVAGRVAIINLFGAVQAGDRLHLTVRVENTVNGHRWVIRPFVGHNGAVPGPADLKNNYSTSDKNEPEVQAQRAMFGGAAAAAAASSSAPPSSSVVTETRGSSAPAAQKEGRTLSAFGRSVYVGIVQESTGSAVPVHSKTRALSFDVTAREMQLARPLVIQFRV